MKEMGTEFVKSYLNSTNNNHITTISALHRYIPLF